MAGNPTIPTHFEVVKIEKKQQEQGAIKGLADAKSSLFFAGLVSCRAYVGISGGEKGQKSRDMGNGHPTFNRGSL